MTTTQVQVQVAGVNDVDAGIASYYPDLGCNQLI